MKYLARLVEIVNKSMKKSNEVDMIKHFVNNSNRSDSEHYDLLRKMLNNGKKGGYISQMHSIYDELSHILNEKNIKPSKIMDIGCGNGNKLEQLGKKFNIPITKWEYAQELILGVITPLILMGLGVRYLVELLDLKF